MMAACGSQGGALNCKNVCSAVVCVCIHTQTHKYLYDTGTKLVNDRCLEISVV